ncbi:MAG: DNA repair exonuclease [Clostridiales bacterium]|nr:DNA repair exonuclease [Clostridiales bacterium]
MKNLKFIHTGDIHLGSFLHIGGNPLPPAVTEASETATLEGFSRVCRAAVSNKVDFIVISGDLFDREARSVKAMDFFAQECRCLDDAGIGVFVIAGNHDPLREQQDLFVLPDNVKIFGGEEPEVFEVLDEGDSLKARIIGQSYQNSREQRKIHLDYDELDSGAWNIALLHTQLESGNSNYVPCSAAELRGREDIHYWALGHIHKNIIINDEKPYIVYSGIPQGRDFGETGQGGCYLVEMDPVKGNSIDFIPLSPVVYKRADIFIDHQKDSPPQTLDDLTDMIKEECERMLENIDEDGEHPIKGYVIQWTLRGRGDIHNLLREQEQEYMDRLAEDLRSRYGNKSPFIWTELIRLRTQPQIDYETLMENNPVFSQLEGVIEKCLEEEETKTRIVKELGDIWKGKGDHEEWEDFRFHLDDDTLEDMLDKAKQLILEKWAEGSERE